MVYLPKQATNLLGCFPIVIIMGDFCFVFLLLYVALRLVFHGGRHGRPGTPKYDSNEKEEEAGTVRSVGLAG